MAFEIVEEEVALVFAFVFGGVGRCEVEGEDEEVRLRSDELACEGKPGGAPAEGLEAQLAEGGKAGSFAACSLYACFRLTISSLVSRTPSGCLSLAELPECACR